MAFNLCYFFAFILSILISCKVKNEATLILVVDYTGALNVMKLNFNVHSTHIFFVSLAYVVAWDGSGLN